MKLSQEEVTLLIHLLTNAVYGDTYTYQDKIKLNNLLKELKINSYKQSYPKNKKIKVIPQSKPLFRY